jgi:hypothetical protein
MCPILMVTTAPFISGMPRRGHFGLHAVPHEARKKTDVIFILSTVPAFLYFYSCYIYPGIVPLYIQEGVQNDYRMAAVFIKQG